MFNKNVSKSKKKSNRFDPNGRAPSSASTKIDETEQPGVEQSEGVEAPQEVRQEESGQGERSKESVLVEPQPSTAANGESSMPVQNSTEATISGKEEKTGSKHWKDTDQAHFELALRMVGTDLTSLEGLIGGRSRKQLKAKFKSIQDAIPNVLELILANPIPFNLEELKAGDFPIGTNRITKKTGGKQGAKNASKEAGTMSPLGAKRKSKSSGFQSMVPAATVTSDKHPLPVPMITNVVVKASLGCFVDPREIALRFRSAELELKVTERVILKIITPKTTAVILPTGIFTCLGASSIGDSLLACRKYARMVQWCGYPVEFKDFKVTNIVAKCNFGYGIKLDEFANIYANGDNGSIKYESEHFVALRFKMLKPKVALNIFDTGTVVLSGGKSVEEVDEGFTKIFNMILDKNLFKY